MVKGIRLIVYPVKDIAQATALYTKLLGIEPYFEAPYYVGYKVGETEIGLDPNGHKEGMTGPLGYWQVRDVTESLQSFVEAGAQIQQEVKDVGDGNLIASVKDADGNVIGLSQGA